jgi:lysozyme
MTTGTKGIILIEEFEGFREKMYKDAVGLPTIGYGTLIDTAEEEYLKTAIITKTEARQLLQKELVHIEKKLAVLVLKPINQNQYDAIVSFCYNLGTQAFRNSTLLKKINIDPNDPTIRTEFLKWVRAGEKILEGLKRRRTAEADLYFS